MIFYTIGVYNSSEQEFFDKLLVEGIDTFCDIRQRRGVRGSKYAFVNSNRLQKRLGDLGINYTHVSTLAPTTSIRELQKRADIEKGELKNERQTLGTEFIEAYKTQVLSQFDFENFFNELERASASHIVLFCVEESPLACHRSLVASRLKDDYRYEVINL